MTIDNISEKQRTLAKKDFNDWAIKYGDVELIESLTSLPPLNEVVKPMDYRISSCEINKLRRCGGDFQSVIFEMIEIHNNYFSNILPNDYMWNTHYIESLSLLRVKIKTAILNTAQDISRQSHRKDNAWFYYANKFESFFRQLCNLEKINQGCVLLFRPFNRDFITAVLLELNKQSPLKFQSQDVVNLFLPYFKKYEIQEITNFNNPFEKWLKEQNTHINKDTKLGMVDDLMEMRSVFFKNWDAEKHRIHINKEFDGIIDIRCAIPSLSIVKREWGKTDRLALDTISWCIYTGEAFYNSSFFISVELNADYLLELLHDYLVTIYSKTNVINKEKVTLSDDSNQVLYSHLKYNSDSDPDDIVDEPLSTNAGIKIRPNIPKVRQNRLFLWLTDHLGCQIFCGKGSEVKIFRPGGRIYILGKHKPNPEVSPWKIKEILKRACIEEDLWIPLVKHL
jgi:hypothetical protein